MNPLPSALALALAAVPADPGRMVPSHDLAGLSLPALREMDGAAGAFWFRVGCPTFTLDGETCVGPWEWSDGTERSAVLVGFDYDLGPGDRVVVAGVLRVIYRPPERVNGVEVPGWWQVTVTREVRLR